MVLCPQLSPLETKHCLSKVHNKILGLDFTDLDIFMHFRDMHLDTIESCTSIVTIVTFVLLDLCMHRIHVPRNIPLPWTFVVADLTVVENSLVDSLCMCFQTSCSCCLEVTPILVTRMHNFLVMGSFMEIQQPFFRELLVAKVAEKLYPLVLKLVSLQICFPLVGL